MLTHQQILHFRTFGFVVLPGLLTAAEVAALSREVTEALDGAFGPVSGEPDDLGGISGDYLPLAVARAPLAMSLIADDPRTFLSSAELLGSPTVPTIGLATRFTGDSGWHTRQGRSVAGVTFWADLAPRRAGTGALRFIPGSHLASFAGRICEYEAAEPATSGFESWDWPHMVVDTEPGDVVAFHAHLRTCNRGRLPRWSWTIDYLPWPGLADRAQLERVRDMAIDSVEYDHEDYDRDRWPAWREWAAGPAGDAASQARGLAVERLRLLGVLPEGGS